MTIYMTPEEARAAGLLSKRSKKPAPPRGCASEHDEQVALMRQVAAYEDQYPALRLLHAIPNGGERYYRVAVKLKAEGVKAGVLDLCLPVARQGFHGLYLEMKAHNGTLKPKQQWWIDALRAEGYRAEWRRGWEAAWAVLVDYLQIEER